jgi:hypothetical protein
MAASAIPVPPISTMPSSAHAMDAGRHSTSPAARMKREVGGEAKRMTLFLVFAGFLVGNEQLEDGRGDGTS